MRKPDSLRAAITAALPDLQATPQNLRIWTQDGRIVATGTRAPFGMEYRYGLAVLLMDFAGDPDRLFAALVRWVAVEQPDLLMRGPERDRGIRFEVDVLDDGKVDIKVTLQLDDAVQEDATGSLAHLPAPALADDDILGGPLLPIGAGSRA